MSGGANQRKINAMTEMKKLSAERYNELRAIKHPVIDELLNVLDNQSKEYEEWIQELEGPTPAELQEKLKNIHNGIAKTLTEHTPHLRGDDGRGWLLAQDIRAVLKANPVEK
jgi:hypothetical protein